MNKLEMAEDPETDAQMLAVLAEDKNVWVRRKVAKNPKTRQEEREVER